MKQLRIALLMQAILLIATGCHRSSQNLSHSRQHQADSVRVAANRELTHLAIACHLYAQQNHGMLPSALEDLGAYIQGSYDLDSYALVASGTLAEIADTSETILIRKRDLLPNGKQAVVYVDGHTEVVPGHKAFAMNETAAVTETLSMSETASADTPGAENKAVSRKATSKKTASSEVKKAPVRTSSPQQPKWHFSR